MTFFLPLDNSIRLLDAYLDLQREAVGEITNGKTRSKGAVCNLSASFFKGHKQEVNELWYTSPSALRNPTAAMVSGAWGHLEWVTYLSDSSPGCQQGLLCRQHCSMERREHWECPV